MNKIIESSLKTLQKAQHLLNILSNEELSNNTISPYYSSIGSHIRHIYDFYDCALNINEEGLVDLTARKRIALIENCCTTASTYFDSIIDRLKNNTIEVNKSIVVIDDLGSGKINIDYTFSALMAQANSHTIHHYAIINYILDRLNIEVSDSDFGYNPTTPKVVPNLI